jgi:hypothetical protein
MIPIDIWFAAVLAAAAAALLLVAAENHANRENEINRVQKGTSEKTYERNRARPTQAATLAPSRDAATQRRELLVRTLPLQAVSGRPHR